MNTVELRQAINAPWTQMEPLRIGNFPAGVRTPDGYATIKKNGEPILRVDVYHYPDDAHVFQEAKVWSLFIIIGVGHRFYWVNPRTGHVTHINLKSYFGSFYTTDECLFISCADRLYCFEADASLRWESTVLGIDGVVVRSATDTEIHGDGEWDPPGGWKPFRLSAFSGALLKNVA